MGSSLRLTLSRLRADWRGTATALEPPCLEVRGLWKELAANAAGLVWLAVFAAGFRVYIRYWASVQVYQLFIWMDSSSSSYIRFVSANVIVLPLKDMVALFAQ